MYAIYERTSESDARRIVKSPESYAKWVSAWKGYYRELSAHCRAMKLELKKSQRAHEYSSIQCKRAAVNQNRMTANGMLASMKLVKKAAQDKWIKDTTIYYMLKLANPE